MFSILRKAKMPSIRFMLVIMVLCATIPSLVIFGWLKSVFLMLCVMAVSGAFAIYAGTRYLAIPLGKILAATKRFAAGELTA
ncbi:MAG: hypothetical protein LBJ22_00145, partial [Synergistaceae bacterium]|nr:hypothetical protein [Synergistaceae bacterium]